MKDWILKLSFASFVLTIGGCGGWIGSAIKNKIYPLAMIERVNLTPEIKPGEPLLLAQHVDRKAQCDVVVKRTIRTSTGQRIPVRQAFEEDFGPVGGDKYVLPIPTDSSATFGDATMYSKAYSWCSWLDYVFGPSESEGWTLNFRFGPLTIQEDPPEAFARIGVKRSSEKPPRPRERRAPAPVEGEVNAQHNGDGP